MYLLDTHTLVWGITAPEELPKRVLDILRVAHVDQLDALAEWHRDPFDRMLIAQALAEDHTLVSRDGAFAPYGVKVVWE